MTIRNSKPPVLPGLFKVTSKLTIKANKDKVWQVLKDFPNVYTWAPSVKNSYALNSKEQGVGAGRYCELDGFGEIEEMVTQWNEGEGFVYDVTPLGPLNNAFSSWWLAEMNNGTTVLTVTLSYDIRFGVFGKMMHKLVMRKKLEDSLPTALEALKERVETGKLVRPLVMQRVVAH